MPILLVEAFALPWFVEWATEKPHAEYDTMLPERSRVPEAVICIDMHIRIGIYCCFNLDEP